jgi:hypothetical protein
MRHRNTLLASATIVVTIISAAQAMYFGNHNISDSNIISLDSISYVFPFQPVAVFYAIAESPFYGIPFNVVLFVMLLYSSGFFSNRPLWVKVGLFLAEWLLLSLIGSVLVLRAVWHV